MSGAIKEQGTTAGSSSQSQIPGMVSINLDLDPSILYFHGSDTCVLKKRHWMIKNDFDAEELGRMMAAAGRGFNPEEGDGDE